MPGPNVDDIMELNRAAGAAIALAFTDKQDARTLIGHLRKRGLNLNAKDEIYTQDGYTALHHSMIANDAAGVALLLELGADLPVRDKLKRTPLELVQWLRQRDSSSNRDAVYELLARTRERGSG